MKTLVTIFIGGGLGSLMRYAIAIYFNHADKFPWGTLIANIISSFILGYLLSWVKIGGVSPSLVLLIAVGFCGAFSTFSTLSFESYQFIVNGNYLLALSYVATSFFLGILAVSLGFYLSH